MVLAWGGEEFFFKAHCPLPWGAQGFCIRGDSWRVHILKQKYFLFLSDNIFFENSLFFILSQLYFSFLYFPQGPNYESLLGLFWALIVVKVWGALCSCFSRLAVQKLVTSSSVSSYFAGCGTNHIYVSSFL